MTERKWIIIDADGQFWNNDYGWCASRHLASEFDDKQQVASVIPPQGAWREMKGTSS